MARPNEDVVNSLPAGQIVLSIFNGNKTLSKIAKALDKAHPTIIEQLQRLEQDKWILREENLYSLNKTKFIDYFVKNYPIDQKVLEKKFDMLINLFASSGADCSINLLGFYIQMTLSLEPAMKKMLMDANKLIKKTKQ